MGSFSGWGELSGVKLSFVCEKVVLRISLSDRNKSFLRKESKDERYGQS